MIVDHDGSRFTAAIQFDQRQAFKDAGWWWNSGAWGTTDIRKAVLFKAFATDAALKVIEAWEQAEFGAVAASCAVDSDIVIPVPAGLAYDPYQKGGVAYAAPRHDTLLADPPGLGKTIQAIALSNYLPEIQRVLVVCPAHLKLNWEREWKKWCVKGLSVELARTKSCSKTTKDMTGTVIGRRTWTEYVWPSTDVVIINYDMLPEFDDKIQGTAWDLLICDEAQYLVSEGTIRTRHVLGGGRQRVKRKGQKATYRPAQAAIPARRRLFLSGTPILSRPIDIWTLAKACDPRGLGKDWMEFIYAYCGAQTLFAGEKHERIDHSGASNLDDLQRKLRQRFMVRRPKSILNLKPKVRQLIPLPQEGLAKLVAAEMSAMERVKAALAAFERLDVEQEPEEPWTTLADALERKFAGHQDKSYEECMSYLSTPEQIAFEELSLARKALAVAKIPMVREHLDGLLATGVKVVVFVVHTEMAEALRQHYPDAGFVTGKTPPNKRQAQVDRFQDDKQCRLFIGNITAAGTGFTMTAGTVVVFAELDWVPAKIEQAEDRTHRRGQTEMVLVQHLAVVGSLDGRLVEVLLQKQAIVHDALDQDALPENLTIETILKQEIASASDFRLLSAP